MLPGLAPRPQHYILNKKDHNEVVNSTSRSLFVFMKDCTNTQVEVNEKVGKVTLEKCNGVKITVNDRVLGGTLELIRCENIEINYGPNAEIPTLQVDNSKNVTINIQSKCQIQSVYYMHTYNIKLILKNTNDGDLEYDFSPLNESEGLTQRIAHWNEASVEARFITEVVVRDNIGPTTAQMRKAAEERKEKNLVKMAEMMVGGIAISKPEKQEGACAQEKSAADERLDEID